MALINKLSAIGDAVRERTGLTDELTLDRMATEIKNIPYPVVEEIEIAENGTYSAPDGVDGYSAVEVNVQPKLEKIEVTSNGTYTPSAGNDGFEEVFVNLDMSNVIPEEALIVTGDCRYRFAFGGSNWLIEQVGDKMITQNITNTDSMFNNNSTLKHIPFDINININNTSSVQEILSDAFVGTLALEKYPNINLISPSSVSNNPKILLGTQCCNVERNVFWEEDKIKIIGFEYDCYDNYKFEEEPDIFNKIDWEVGRTLSTFGTVYPVAWNNSKKIKYIPHMKDFWTTLTGNYYHTWYQFNISNCYNLRGITLPRPGEVSLTSSPLGFLVTNLYSLKDFVFDVKEDGTPYTAKWKNVNLQLQNGIGYGAGISTFEDVDERGWVTDQTSYEAYKHQDYVPNKIEYSRYNLASAVRTIKSLPDCSATGTNTIKFRTNAGSLTDEGAINTMSAEDIAIASAKGWTVAYA